MSNTDDLNKEDNEKINDTKFYLRGTLLELYFFICLFGLFLFYISPEANKSYNLNPDKKHSTDKYENFEGDIKYIFILLFLFSLLGICLFIFYDKKMDICNYLFPNNIKKIKCKEKNKYNSIDDAFGSFGFVLLLFCFGVFLSLIYYIDMHKLLKFNFLYYIMIYIYMVIIINY